VGERVEDRPPGQIGGPESAAGLALVEEQPARGGAGVEVDHIAAAELGHLEPRLGDAGHQLGRPAPSPARSALLVQRPQAERVHPRAHPPGVERRVVAAVGEGHGHIPEPLDARLGEPVVVPVDPEVGVGVGRVEQRRPGLEGDDRGELRTDRVRCMFRAENLLEAGRRRTRHLRGAGRRMLEPEGRGVEEHPSGRVAAVLGVAQDRQPERGGMGTHLVGAAGVRVGGVAPPPCTRRGPREVRRRGLPGQRLSTRQRVGPIVIPARDELVGLGDLPLLELRGERTVGQRRLAEEQQSGGALVEAVQDRQRLRRPLPLHPLVHPVLGVDVGPMGVDACGLPDDEDVLVLEVHPGLRSRGHRHGIEA
jgi:hypothetical protein